jgi:hypothetical protein
MSVLQKAQWTQKDHDWNEVDFVRQVQGPGNPNIG